MKKKEEGIEREYEGEGEDHNYERREFILQLTQLLNNIQKGN